MDTMQAVKETFIKIYNDNIKRKGAKEFLDYLCSSSSDFFEAPASTRFHSSEPGGLCMHSIKVYYRLKELVANEKSSWAKNITDESIAIVGLLHDVCKINFYKVEIRNRKDESGEWIKVPFYTVDEELPYGHGEKSVYILSSYMKLSRDEAMAINWHMGGFDPRVLGGSYQLGPACYKHPFAVLAHAADLFATYFDENPGGNE
ncbi:MAG: hydrolase [Clostridiales bacterium]|jgi:hypothetical protein|nr:hydrolase [Clostridiales bacterium]